MPRLSRRVDLMAESATVGFSDRVRQAQRAGKDIIGLTLGEPDFDTPQHVKDAAIAALQAGHTKYVAGAGIPELRDAVAAYESKNNKIPCKPANVLVSPAKHAIFLSLLSIIEAGDEVLIPDPSWVSYVPIIQWAGAKAVPVPITAENGFRMTPEAVQARITPKTKAILLNSPSNPTGGVDSPSDVRGIMDLAIKHDLWVVSDEIYQNILYEGSHLSPASLPGGFERTITVNGLSKSFAMTGWRLGWLVAPPTVHAAASKLQSHTITHCTSFAQYGAVAALEGPQDSVKAMAKEFHARRDLFVPKLAKIPGVQCPIPKGAFYAFAKFDPKVWGGDDGVVGETLLQAGVAGTPGAAFGAGGRNHVRFSYAASRDTLARALERIGGAVP